MVLFHTYKDIYEAINTNNPVKAHSYTLDQGRHGGMNTALSKNAATSWEQVHPNLEEYRV
jgi:hypothetical protein